MAEVDGKLVECRSYRAVESLINAIRESVRQVLTSSDDIPSHEKERLLEQFTEIYSTSFKSSVSIDGLEWQSGNNHLHDETTEFTPINSQKKNYINETLVEKINDSVFKVSNRRKQYPHVVSHNYRKLINSRIVKSVKREVEIESSHQCNTEKHLITEDPASCTAAFTDLSSQVKEISETMNKAERIQKSRAMFKATKRENLNNSVIQNNESQSSLQTEYVKQFIENCT